jgi:hypothetical protein
MKLKISNFKFKLNGIEILILILKLNEIEILFLIFNLN